MGLKSNQLARLFVALEGERKIPVDISEWLLDGLHKFINGRGKIKLCTCLELRAQGHEINIPGVGSLPQSSPPSSFNPLRLITDQLNLTDRIFKQVDVGPGVKVWRSQLSRRIMGRLTGGRFTSFPSTTVGGSG